ncbi:uncharacterized protein LACBIDRAFT_312088 [Laccaria bicolor S238N-H82]|uniref:Predicted protein n=1 Tax=Laccaria bicolor (strain S238N-H82 / ATCC MYA-4686) TaxID=486041 RepID=B0CZ20_LACBS|nr:uncharacterized protein LACBIDRAFT_312088 [Laccaria bicolor S238N-H82]EDR12986.1 predicted protein [Laccaria bicolor S238N-H82]|eukprot:XP_001877250.1 predicted protein [Laccaria bicolor S238N-H82]
MSPMHATVIFFFSSFLLISLSLPHDARIPRLMHEDGEQRLDPMPPSSSIVFILFLMIWRLSYSTVRNNLNGIYAKRICVFCVLYAKRVCSMC